MDQCQAAVSSQSLVADVLTSSFVRGQAKAIERLPFTIKRVQSDEDMRKAVQIRHSAYARHVPEFAKTLREPEMSDYEEDCIVLLAESKLDGSPLGSMRVQTNQGRRLSVEQSIALPEWLQGRRLAELSRLGVDGGRIGRVVKVALFKACFEYCENNRIDYLVLTGRTPVDRQYEQLLCTDVFEEKKTVPLQHVGNIPHRIMSFEIATGEERWEAVNHPLLGFFRHTRHPDIDISKKAMPRAVRVPSVPRMPEHARTQMHSFALA
ncbi:MAG: hypothetical protein V4693_22875 [Pseudomonadota bacterium]